MLKEAIEKIVAMTKPEILSLEGRNYAVGTDGAVHEIKHKYDHPNAISLHSLDALVKMIKSEGMERWGYPLYVAVQTHENVVCFGQPTGEESGFVRVNFYSAEATDVPGWGEKTVMGFEEAIIALQTRFQHSIDTEYALKLLSEITSGSKVTYNDNGIAQTVVTQKGIAMQGVDKIKPILELRPYRTFQEIEQPASKFLIRVNERGITFIEADGGMWKMAARKTIAEHLEKALETEIEAGRIVVML